MRREEEIEEGEEKAHHSNRAHAYIFFIFLTFYRKRTDNQDKVFDASAYFRQQQEQQEQLQALKEQQRQLHLEQQQLQMQGSGGSGPTPSGAGTVPVATALP